MNIDKTYLLIYNRRYERKRFDSKIMHEKFEAKPEVVAIKGKIKKKGKVARILLGVSKVLLILGIGMFFKMFFAPAENEVAKVAEAVAFPTLYTSAFLTATLGEVKKREAQTMESNLKKAENHFSLEELGF